MSDEFQIGDGCRACHSYEELTKYNVANVYISCLTCSYEWYIPKEDWKFNRPIYCLSCGGQALAHEYATLNAITHRWKRKNSRSPLEIVPITHLYQGAVIRRIVQIQSII